RETTSGCLLGRWRLLLVPLGDPLVFSVCSVTVDVAVFGDASKPTVTSNTSIPCRLVDPGVPIVVVNSKPTGTDVHISNGALDYVGDIHVHVGCTEHRSQVLFPDIGEGNFT
uniref:ZP domain-containing protein n=1 Tax=Mesocestoides corti TaxID=53468 RepID=A0A5K3G0I2_MESCO